MPYVAPSTDKLLAMEAVDRSFSPGIAAGLSSLRPQYLFEGLNSANIAAKAGLLEALMTLFRATSSGHLQPSAALDLCSARLIPLRKMMGEYARLQWATPCGGWCKSGSWRPP